MATIYALVARVYFIARVATVIVLIFSLSCFIAQVLFFLS